MLFKVCWLWNRLALILKESQMFLKVKLNTYCYPWQTMTTSDNDIFEAQFKNIFVLWKSYVTFLRSAVS